MKLKRILITALVVTVLLAVTAMPIYATTSNKVLYLQSNQYWTQGFGEAHDINYYYCGARCHSVYPPSGTDTYTRIDCKVTNTYNVVVTVAPYYTLNESASGYSYLQIKNGYLGTATVYFAFRGHTNADAYAVVSFTGTLTN